MIVCFKTLTDINSYATTKYKIFDTYSFQKHLEKIKIKNENTKNLLLILNEKIETEENLFHEDISTFTYKGFIDKEDVFLYLFIFFFIDIFLKKKS